MSISGDTYSSPRCFTCANFATDTQPRYQPNGFLIAYLSTQVLQYESDRYRIKLYDRSTGKITVLTENWDRSVSSISWTPDGKYLLAEALEFARTKVYRISLTGDVTYMIVDHTNKASRMLPDGSILFSRQALTFPLTIFQWFPSTNSSMPLTRFNEMFIEKCIMATPQEFWFAGANGDQIHGWYLPPVFANTTTKPTKVPLAYLIHGGPQSSWADDWSYRWNPQIYAAHGFATADIDFHGSQGYGQAFTDSIINDYG